MKSFIKRFFPFFLTLALGLLAASFFVTVSAPKFNNFKRDWKQGKCFNLKRENWRLRQENNRLRKQLQDKDLNPTYLDRLEVPPPPMPPMPPKAPMPVLPKPSN